MVKENKVYVESPELVFVLSCLNYPKVNNDSINNSLIHDLDWNLVFNIAMNNRVFPHVYKTICLLDLQKVPDQFIEQIRSQYKKNSFVAIVMAGEIIRISRAMKDKNISIVILKGIPLAEKLYNDITIRASRDIDILINYVEFKIADDSLQTLNYIRKSYSYNNPKLDKVIYHDTYINYEKGICVELHWKTTYLEIGELLELSSYQTQLIDLWSNDVPIFADVELLLYLIIHASNHMFHKLMWLADIGILIQNINIEEIYLKIDDIKCSIDLKLLLDINIILLMKLLNINILNDYDSLLQNRKTVVLSEIVIKSLNNRLTEKHSRIKTFIKMVRGGYYHLSIRLGWKSKLEYIKRSILEKLIKSLCNRTVKLAFYSRKNFRL